MKSFKKHKNVSSRRGMCLFQTTLEAIQPIQSLSEESVSFKGLIQTKHDLEDFQFLKAICIVALKTKLLRNLLF